MPRLDEAGHQHPTDDDLLTITAEIHLLYCRECNQYALPKPKPDRA